MQVRYRQVEAFKSVMLTGTTTGAASMMSVTQPAVSRLISDLEVALKFSLFKRHKGRLLPTPEAIEFYRGVENFFVSLDSLEKLADQIRTQDSTDLHICATPALSTFFFPHAVKHFKGQHPKSKLLLESAPSSEIVRRLQMNLTHLALTASFPQAFGIIQETLIETSHVCAVNESHPLAKKAEITPEDLIGEEVLEITPSGLNNWDQLYTVLEEAGITYSHSIGIQNSHTGYSLVAANLAVALIEPFAAKTWFNNGVVVKPFEPKIPYRYVIAYSESQPVTKESETFVEIAKEVFSQFNICG
ncbi:LysR substrate-binding domain-containing protein [Parasalinivibrio latis]|uniref:LysR family transcriptional regulator n=1 Tax=Parasalinivibrio latis TaxID=2952610 RepID=UPI0030E2A3A0